MKKPVLETIKQSGLILVIDDQKPLTSEEIEAFWTNGIVNIEIPFKPNLDSSSLEKQASKHREMWDPERFILGGTGFTVREQVETFAHIGEFFTAGGERAETPTCFDCIGIKYAFGLRDLYKDDGEKPVKIYPGSLTIDPHTLASILSGLGSHKLIAPLQQVRNAFGPDRSSIKWLFANGLYAVQLPVSSLRYDDGPIALDRIEKVLANIKAGRRDYEKEQQ